MAIWPFIKELIFGKKDPMLVMHHNPTTTILAVTCIVLAIMCVGFMYSSFMLSQELAIARKVTGQSNVSVEDIDNLRKDLENINERMNELAEPE